MDKINWCLQKKDGLKLIESNSNLANAYLIKAEEALETMRINVVKDWKISTAYYTIYFSLYAIFMKLGVKCEIHSCTIEFTKVFLREFFDDTELELIQDAQKARVDSQYYVDRTVPDEKYNEIISSVPLFFVKCKNLFIKLNEKKIKEVRANFQEKIDEETSE